MPAAIAIPSIIGAATSIGGAAMGAKASKDAAKTQQAAADKAMRVNEQVYNDQKALFSPYSGAGGQSVSMLGRLLGAPAGAQFAAAPSQGAQMAAFPSYQPPQQGMGPQGPQAVPRGPIGAQQGSAPGQAMPGAPQGAQQPNSMMPGGWRPTPYGGQAPQGGTGGFSGQPLPPPSQVPGYQPGQGPALASMAPRRGPMQPPPQGGSMAPQGGSVSINLRSPDGQQISVPAEQAGVYLSRGFLRQ